MVELGTTKSATILVVNDEPQIQRVMRAALSVQGYNIFEARDGQRALEVFWSETPDLVLLDLDLPVIDGFEVCREIRCASKVPIIVLSVCGAEKDKIQALDAGADDYVVKPFGIQELLARIPSSLRRSSNNGNETGVSSNDLSVDFEGRIVTVRGRQIHLTPKEFALLRVLIVSDSKLIPYQRLLYSVWGPDHGDDIECLRVVITQLRKKIEPDPSQPTYIQTEPYVGYRFVLPTDARVAPKRAPDNITNVTVSPR
jgi:two-component system, OmpR family, KDP operon response regulator KdpE